MSTKSITRQELKEIEIVETYCDKCGALIDSAETLDDGYNSTYSAGEFKVTVDIQNSNSLEGRWKKFEATLCKECSAKAMREIKDGVTKLFADVVMGEVVG